MKKVISKTLLAMTMLLSGSMALAGGLTLGDLKTGDVLSGTEVLTGRACSVTVTAASRGKISAALTVGQTTYKSVDMEKEFSLKVLYVGKYSSITRIDSGDGEQFYDNIEGTLNQNILNGNTRFQVYRVLWGQHNYRMFDPHIDCNNLKLN